MNAKQKKLKRAHKRVDIWCDNPNRVRVTRREQLDGATGGRMYGTTVTLRDEELGISMSLTLSDLNISATVRTGKHICEQKFWDLKELLAREQQREMEWQEWG